MQVENDQALREEYEEEAPFALSNHSQRAAAAPNIPTPTTRNDPAETTTSASSESRVQEESIVAASEAACDGCMAGIIIEEEEDSCSLGFSSLMRKADDTFQDSSSPLAEMCSTPSRIIDDKSTGTSVTDLVSNCRKRIVAQKLGEDSFTVEFYIPQTTVRSAMESASNPDLLRFWCHSIINAIVTKESGKPGKGNQREYDGEWIEAAANIRSPSGHTLYHCFSGLKSYFGFPSHGRATLFIERHRGQLSLTIGPVGGASEVLHTLTFLQHDRGVRVTDKVQIQLPDRICSLCPRIQRYCFPSLQSHIDQAVMSMADLKVLIEHGETAAERVSWQDQGYMAPLLGPTL